MQSRRIAQAGSARALIARGKLSTKSTRLAAFFFTEQQRTEVPFQAADLLQTNKQVALFADTAQDGAIMGRLWEQQAPRFGYRVVYQTQVCLSALLTSRSQTSAARQTPALDPAAAPVVDGDRLPGPSSASPRR